MKNVSKIEPLPSMTIIAAQDYTPEMGLLYLEPCEDFPAGHIRNVYAINTEENTVICHGYTPKDWRRAAISGNFESELILRCLPSTIEEVPLDEYRNKQGKSILQLVYLNAKAIPMPVPKVAPKRIVCKVRQHPATYELLQNTPAKTKAAPANTIQLVLFENLNQTA